MKKVLSFVLVLAMILGSVSMAFAVTPGIEFNKKMAKPFEDAPNSYLATVLRDLNVLQGNDDKVFLDQTISRAEVCAILMRVLGYEDYCTAAYAINAVSSFSDVASGYWANGYINLAAQLGYVSGVGNGKFNPTGNVGLNDGVAFIMKALGYSAEHLSLDWPYNFLVPAEANGLLKGVEKTDDALTREQMFTILYNAMDEPIVSWQANLTNVVLNNNDKVGSWEPVKVNGITQTFAIKAAGSGKTTDNYSSSAAIVTEEMIASAAAAKLDLSEYFGKYVKLLTLTNGGTYYYGLGVVDTLSTKLTGVVEKDLAGNVVTIAGVKVVSSAATGFRLDDCFILENGEASNNTNIVAKVTPIEAEVVLNAKGEIASLASIQYWVPTKDIMVNATQAAWLQSGIAASQAAFEDQETVVFKTSGEAAKKNLEIVEVEVLGAASSLDEIKEDDILTLYTSGSGIHKVEVSREIVSGVKLTKIDAGYMYFDGVKYYESDNMTSECGVNFTSTYALYLNAAGEIAYIDNLNVDAPVAPALPNYGFFITASAVKEYTLVDKSLKEATNASVSIVPFGTTAATKYTFVSYAAAGMAEVFDNADLKATIKYDDYSTECIVAYKLDKDGVVNVITDSGLDIENAGKATISALGIPSKNKLFADDVEIYVLTNTGVKGVKVAMKTPADLAGVCYDEVSYVLNKAGKISYVFCFGDSSVTDTTVPAHVTFAAYISKGEDVDGIFYNFLVDGEAKTIRLQEDLADVAFTTDKAWYINLEDGEVTGKVEYTTKKAVTSTSGLVYKDGVLTAVTDQYTCISPVVYDATGAKFVVAEVADIVDAAKADLYDTNDDGFFDVIVITEYVAEE